MGIAVVTGAASGIGYAIAERCVAEGTPVVLADVEADALEQAADTLGRRGQVVAVPTDVTDAAAVEELARQAEGLGPVELVCNNAGVTGGPPSPSWEKPVSAWRWALDVNLWGVIHGIRAFLPAMVERDRGHIVNTASVAGLMPFPFSAPYAASKHAVVGISLSIHNELQLLGSNVGVSVLCPGWVRTRIADADRNWPESLGPKPAEPDDEVGRMLQALARQLIEDGADPPTVAEAVLDAVANRRFWVLPNAEPYADLVREVTQSALEGRDPPLPPFA